MSHKDSSGAKILSDLSKFQYMIETMSGINYIIDRDYKIQLYSKDSWDTFARGNDGDKLLVDQNIRGKSILDYLAGNKVRDYYKKIYDLIFEGKREQVTIKSNCDAPEVLRDNVLYLTPLYADFEKKEKVIGIFHQSLIVKVRERNQVRYLKNPEKRVIEEKAQFFEICSICKFVHYKDDEFNEWVSSERYYQLGGTDEIKLDHTICPDCTSMLDEFM